MTVYAYLRVSSIQQDEQNQRQGVDAKADSLSLCIDKYIVDKVSGTREALEYRRQQGIKLGRPVGSKTKNHKLDAYRDKILLWLKKGVSRRRIAKRCKVCDKTLRRYISERLKNV